jgi:glycosyltransferase involved in cell wall biosynthesis
MNILLTNFHPGNGGGHLTYLTYLFNEFSKIQDSDLSVFIAVPATSKLNFDLKKKYSDRVFDIEFPTKIKEFIQVVKNIRALAKLIKNINISIVHVNGNPDHKIVALCKWIYGFSFKIIRTKHDVSPIKNKWTTNKLFGKYADRIILVSNYQYNNLLNKSMRRKSFVIHNGIDLEYYQPVEKSKELMSEYRISDDELIFVSVAGTNINKGWQYLVEAVSRLDYKLQSKIRIVIAGNIPNKYIIHEYVDAFNMQDNVIFTGILDDVMDVISIADIGFVLSQKEALSIACREMMAMGKPVLVSNVGGLPENISNNQDGWIVKQGSIDQIQEFLQRAKELDLCEFSNSAIQKAKKEFGLDDFIQATLDAYSY